MGLFNYAVWSTKPQLFLQQSADSPVWATWVTARSSERTDETCGDMWRTNVEDGPRLIPPRIEKDRWAGRTKLRCSGRSGSRRPGSLDPVRAAMELGGVGGPFCKVDLPKLLLVASTPIGAALAPLRCGGSSLQREEEGACTRPSAGSPSMAQVRSFSSMSGVPLPHV